MKAEFDLSGYTLRIGGTRLGGMSENGGECCGGVAEGDVALQVFQQPLSALKDDSSKMPREGFYLMGASLKPSHARAIASALLSAAIEARQ